MNRSIENPRMMIELSEINVASLLKLRSASSESLDSVISRLLTPSQTQYARTHETECQSRSLISNAGAKYACEVLGERLYGQTLPLLFGAVVDFIHNAEPQALEHLAILCTRKRKFISKSHQSIHPGRANLPVFQTKSGWWISKNVGTKDIIRALQATCTAAKIKFGEDIKFPVR